MLLPLVLAALAQSPRFTPLNHRQLPSSKGEFTFVALGDNRPAGAGLPPTRTFKELLSEVAIVGPAFVLSSGDLLYGNEETLPQYKQEVVWMKPLLEALPCPFFNVPGNHEINDRPEFLAEYTKSLGPTYGEFDFGGVRFLAVCTELPAPKPSVTGAELEWLKGEMAAPAPTVVFEHHPVFMRATNPDAKGDAEVDDAESLHKLYLSGGVKAVFEGHDHVYNAQVHDGIRYTIAGGAGAPLDTQPLDGGFFHFLLVHVKNGEIEMTPFPLGALEVVPQGSGVAAAANYADSDLPLTNLRIECQKEPKGVTAGYSTKTGKAKAVAATIVGSVRKGAGWIAQVALTLPKHRATIVRLTY